MAGTQLIEHRRPSDRVDEDLMASLDDDDGGRPLGLLSAISRRTGLVLCLPGVLGAAASVVGLQLGCSAQPQPRLEPRTMPWTVADASTVRTSGPAEVVVQTMTLRSRPDQRLVLPPGLHLVIQARSYGPGQPYIGGDGVHLAGNKGEVPVDMGVTYLIAPGQSMAVSRVPHQAPTTCPVL